MIKSLPQCEIHPWPPGDNVDPNSISISFGMNDKLLGGNTTMHKIIGFWTVPKLDLVIEIIPFKREKYVILL